MWWWWECPEESRRSVISFLPLTYRLGLDWDGKWVRQMTSQLSYPRNNRGEAQRTVSYYSRPRPTHFFRTCPYYYKVVENVTRQRYFFRRVRFDYQFQPCLFHMDHLIGCNLLIKDIWERPLLLPPIAQWIDTDLFPVHIFHISQNREHIILTWCYDQRLGYQLPDDSIYEFKGWSQILQEAVHVTQFLLDHFPRRSTLKKQK